MASTFRTRIDARRWAAGLSLSLSLTLTATALAQPAADPLFEEGRVLMQQSRYAEACAKFQASFDLAPSAGRAFNLSACEEQQSHFVKAVSWLDIGLGQLGSDDPRAKDATTKRVEIVGRMPKLTVKLTGGDPASSTIDVNGTVVPNGVRTPTDPGKTVVTVKSKQRKDVTTTIELQEKEVRAIEVAVGAALPDDTVKPPGEPPTRKPTPEPPSNVQAIAGWVTGGVGVAATVGAIVTGSIMLAQNGAYHDCAKAGAEEDRCADQEDARALGESLEIPNAVLWGVGLAGIGTGLIVILTAPSGSVEPASTVGVIPSFGPSHAGATFYGTF